MSASLHPYDAYELTEAQWLSEIPSHWELFEAKRLFSNRREASHSTDEQLAASQQYGVVPQSLMMAMNDAKVMLALKGTSSFRHVVKDDFVISLRSFEGGIEHSEYTGCVSPAYTVLAAKKKLCSSYFKFLMKCESFVAALQSTTDSLRDGKAISYKDFGSLDLPFPEYTEQKQIAAFLDYETAKIDALIEKQQQLIVLLGEKRQAVISHAVTKGLNPDVPMRDSGVEWLGEVPEHWVVMTVRNMLRAGVLETQDGNHGELHPVAADYVDEGVPFLMANNVRNGRVSLNPCNFLTKEHADSLRIGFARRGDLLLTHKGTVGEVAMVPESLKDYWMLTPQVTYYRWKNTDYSPYYYYYLFQSLAVLEQLRVIGGKQSTRAYVGLVAQKEIVLLVPPVAEQNAIVKLLSALTDDGLDALTSKAVDKISLLEERRSALISSAVTGKIDVRNWKPPTDDKRQKPKKEAA